MCAVVMVMVMRVRALFVGFRLLGRGWGWTASGFYASMFYRLLYWSSVVRLNLV